MERIDFLAIGDSTTDAFIDLRDATVFNDGGTKKLCMRFGEKLPYRHIDIIDGVGNAANAAVTAARLGTTSSLYTFVGDDTRGNAAHAVWKKNGVSTHLVRTDTNFPTHYHLVLRFGAERTILIRHEKWHYSVDDMTDTLPSWIYFSSMGEHTEYFHHDLALYLKEHPTVKLAFQPGTFQIQLSAHGRIDDIYAHTELFFCNKEEAQQILASSQEQPILLAKKLAEKGPRIVVVTDGPRGAFVWDGTHSLHVPMYPDPHPPVDRTGAGDAFSATVTAQLARGKPLPEALLYGPINSMSVVQYIGAQRGLLSTEKIEELLRHAPQDYTIKDVV